MHPAWFGIFQSSPTEVAPVKLTSLNFQKEITGLNFLKQVYWSYLLEFFSVDFCLQIDTTVYRRVFDLLSTISLHLKVSSAQAPRPNVRP